MPTLEKNRTILNASQFAQLIADTKGARIFTMRTITDCSKSKAKGAPVVLRDSFVRAIVGFNYASAINGRLKEEGKEQNFHAQPRKWGVRLLKNGKFAGIVQHGEKLYLECQVLRSLRGSKYYLNGKPATKEQCAPFIKPPSAAPSTQANLEKKLFIRDYAFNSIREVNFSGQRIELA